MRVREFLCNFISHFICLHPLQTTPPPETNLVVEIDGMSSYIVEIPQGESESDGTSSYIVEISQGESDSQTINSSDPDEIDEESPLSDSDNQVTVTASTSASSAHPTDHRCYRRPAPPATSSISPDNPVRATASTSASSAQPTDHHRHRRPATSATTSISSARVVFKHLFGLVTIYSVQPEDSVVSHLILVSYGLGYAAVVVGSSIPSALPRLAKILREFGEHILVTVIFSVIAMHLPLYLSWIMLLCWLISVASVRLGYSADSTATSTV